MLLLLQAGCNGLKSSSDPVAHHGPRQMKTTEERQEKQLEYERLFSSQVDQAYNLFRREMPIPTSELVEAGEIHVEFALSGKDFWQNLRAGFTEIGRDTRSDFTDRFITIPHQGGVRIGFVDLVRANAIWDAIRGDAKTDLVLELDIPMVPDRIVHENPEQYPAKKPLDGSSGVYHVPPFTIIPRGHVINVQGAKFADGSLRFAKFDIRFPELKQDGKRNVKTTRSGTFRQIKTTSWREAPKVRRENLSLSQLVLPRGVALVALVPAECTELSQPSDGFHTYALQRNTISTSLIVLILPKRVTDAFEDPPEYGTK